MKQRHSFHQLLYHLVLHVKDRYPLIESEEKVHALMGFMIAKAPSLDAFIEEFGGWRDHVHLLMRCGPTRPLSDVYGQLKGFSWAAWRKHYPEIPFRWGDGVFVSTVNPDDNTALREYIRDQWRHHEEHNLVTAWEIAP